MSKEVAEGLSGHIVLGLTVPARVDRPGEFDNRREHNERGADSKGTIEEPFSGQLDGQCGQNAAAKDEPG